MPLSATTIRHTLDLIALLQPVDPEKPEFQTLAPVVIAEPIDRIKRSIQLLFDAAVLVRRGRLFRIMPDVLADYILEDRCVTRATHASSGYIDRVLATADAASLANILVNVTKLDWRLSEQDKVSVCVAESAWQCAEALYRSQPESRDALEKAIARAAYFQPARALDFYDTARQLAVDQNAFPSLLKHAAMNIDHVEEACRRLWDLGKTDKRRLNQYPDHPIRILRDLVAVQPEKPVEYCERVVDFVLRLVETPEVSGGAYSPFEILEPALATEGHVSESRGFSIVMKGFGVRRTAVTAMRERIIDFLLKQIQSPNIGSAVRAASCIESALRYPMGFAGRQVSTDERADWGIEFCETLKKLKRLVESVPLDPLVLVCIQRAVHWHAHFSDGPTKAPARAVTAAVPESVHYRLTLALADGWGHLQARQQDPQHALERWRIRQQEIVGEFGSSIIGTQAAVEVLAARLCTIAFTEGVIDTAPGVFIRLLAESKPDIADALCDTVLADVQSPLRPVFGEALCGLARTNPARALDHARRALSSAEADLSRAVAWAYSVRAGASSAVAAEERDLLGELVQSADDWTVIHSLRGVASFAERDPAGTLTTLLKARIERSSRIADEFFSLVLHTKALPFESLTPSAVTAILEKLVPCPSIENHWVGQFLGKASERYPAARDESST